MHIGALLMQLKVSTIISNLLNPSNPILVSILKEQMEKSWVGTSREFRFMLLQK